MKSFDLYAKADSMVLQKTTTGALITLVSSIFMFFLFISEYGAYKEIRVADHMTIDPAYGEQIVSVNLSSRNLSAKPTPTARRSCKPSPSLADIGTNATF